MNCPAQMGMGGGGVGAVPCVAICFFGGLYCNKWISMKLDSDYLLMCSAALIELKTEYLFAT